jgi:hypothetical protein
MAKPLKLIPIASEATATSVNPGLFAATDRKRMSARSDSNKTHDYSPPTMREDANRGQIL